jgi:hypothetical protein
MLPQGLLPILAAVHNSALHMTIRALPRRIIGIHRLLRLLLLGLIRDPEQQIRYISAEDRDLRDDLVATQLRLVLREKVTGNNAIRGACAVLCSVLVQGTVVGG